MLIFGDPTPPKQRGMPFPEVKYALAIPATADELALLHRFGCAELPELAMAAAAGFREIVYSTTYDELHDYAGHALGDEGWVACHHCGG